MNTYIRRLFSSIDSRNDLLLSSILLKKTIISSSRTAKTINQDTACLKAHQTHQYGLYKCNDLNNYRNLKNIFLKKHFTTVKTV